MINETNSSTTELLCERYVVISNISKVNNICELCRVAAAYNFKVILVCPPKLSNKTEHHLPHELIHLKFISIEETSKFLKDRNIPLVGLEILKESTSVLECHFGNSIAIMPGNEGTGLSKKQRLYSDWFVYIPHYGDGTASLNVFVATTIILHRYNLSINSK